MPRAQASAFANDDADEQRADEARALRHRDRVDVRPATAALGQRALDDAADVADVLARRELRHDAAPLAVNLDLRGDDVRADRARPRRVAGLRDDGRRRLVARGLDAEDGHQAAASIARFSDSLYGARTMPLSVMMPAT